MEGLAVISGSAGALGTAVRQALEARGLRVLGIDLAGAEVCEDLGTAQGRLRALDAVARACEGRLQALVCAAGLGGTVRPSSRTVSVNHFGVLALLDGLQPVLAQGRQPAAVAVASVSATAGPWATHPLTAACLAGDEARACMLADRDAVAYAGYGCSKHALVQALRLRAPAWAAVGVRLNALLPGPMDTPLHQAALGDPLLGPATRAFPLPLGRIAHPLEVARVIDWMLSPAASLMHGAAIFVDGGCDAMLRPTAF